MMNSHKDKERVRYNKQIKLLDRLFAHIPKITDECPTKVRKLRRLVVYSKFLQLLMRKLKDSNKKSTGKNVSAVTKCTKPSYQKIEVAKPYEAEDRRASRAHIVFLNPVKQKKTSTNCEVVTNKNYGKLGNTSVYDSGYKMPDVIKTCQGNPNNASNIYSNADFSDRNNFDDCLQSCRNVTLNGMSQNSFERSHTNNALDHDKENFVLPEANNSTTILKHNQCYESLPMNEKPKYCENAGSNSISLNLPNYILHDITNLNQSRSNKNVSSNALKNFQREEYRNKDAYPYHYFNDKYTLENHRLAEIDSPLRMNPEEKSYSDYPLFENISSQSSNSSSDALNIDVENLSDCNISPNIENFSSFKLNTNSDSSIDSSQYSDNSVINPSPSAYPALYVGENHSIYNIPSYSYPESSFFMHSALHKSMDEAGPSYIPPLYSNTFNPGSTYLRPSHPILDEKLTKLPSFYEGYPLYPVDSNASHSKEHFHVPKDYLPNYLTEGLEGRSGLLPDNEISYSIAQYFLNTKH